MRSLRFEERTYRDAFGHIVIIAPMSAPVDRRHFEKQFFPGIEVGLAGWERSHSQGAGTGNESPFAVRYAPHEVNDIFQGRMEHYLRQLVKTKTRDVTLWLTTVTSTHTGTLRLKEIQYRVDAVKGYDARRIFEAAIGVENCKSNPRITIRVIPYS